MFRFGGGRDKADHRHMAKESQLQKEHPVLEKLNLCPVEMAGIRAQYSFYFQLLSPECATKGLPMEKLALHCGHSEVGPGTHCLTRVPRCLGSWQR